VTFAQQFPNDLNNVIFSRQRLRRAEGRVSLPAAITGGSQGWITVARLALPRTDHGYITAYSNEVIDPSWDYNGAIQFRVLANGSPVDDCDGFSEFRGSIPVPAQALFFIQPGGTVLLQTRRAIAGVAARDVVMSALVITWAQQMMSPYPGDTLRDTNTRHLK
jgi:hypothetical protein